MPHPMKKQRLTGREGNGVSAPGNGVLLIILVACLATTISISQFRQFYLCNNPATTRSSDAANTNDKNCDPTNFLVLIKAGATAKYQQRRKIWRESSCPATYKNYSMSYHFMLGLPAHETIDPHGHNQGKRASEEEILDMVAIRNESIVHKDMEFMALKDVYDDFYLKTLRTLEWAVNRGITSQTSIIVLHDDEYCLRPAELERICMATSANESIYAGNHLWGTPAYDEQKGFDGSSFAPYFSGHMEALSVDLVKDITSDPETLFTSINLGNSEDVQLGKWVQNQNKTRKIKYVAEESLAWEMPLQDENENAHATSQ